MSLYKMFHVKHLNTKRLKLRWFQPFVLKTDTEFNLKMNLD